jgi:hypothetical protein
MFKSTNENHDTKSFQKLKSDDFFLYAGKGNTRIFEAHHHTVLYYIRNGLNSLLMHIRSEDTEQDLLTFYLNTIKVRSFFTNSFNNGAFDNGIIRSTFKDDTGKSIRKDISPTQEMCLYRINSIKNTIKEMHRIYKYQLTKEGIDV